MPWPIPLLPPVTRTTRDGFTGSRYRVLRNVSAEAYADVVTDGEMGTHTRTVAESGRRGSAPLITDARMATSDEMSSRIRRYTITMAFRAACFVSMIFVHGAFRWVLFACAVVLPLIAVIAANQVNQHFRSGKMTHALPSDRPQITTGHDDETTNNEVFEEDGSQRRSNERVA